MRLAFSAALTLVLTATAARGQFELLSVERRVQADAATMTLSGVDPLAVEIGDPAMGPWASQSLRLGPHNFGSTNAVRCKWIDGTCTGTAASTTTMTFAIQEPLTVAYVGYELDPTGSFQLIGPSVSIIGMTPSGFHERVFFAPGTYTAEIGIGINPNEQFLNAALWTISVPEPSMWLVVSIMLVAGFTLHRRRRRSTHS